MPATATAKKQYSISHTLILTRLRTEANTISSIKKTDGCRFVFTFPRRFPRADCRCHHQNTSQTFARVTDCYPNTTSRGRRLLCQSASGHPANRFSESFFLLLLLSQSSPEGLQYANRPTSELSVPTSYLLFFVNCSLLAVNWLPLPFSH